MGTYFTLAGMAVLVGGMLSTTRIEWMWLSLAALILGLVLSQFGGYNMRRWGRRPRPDQVIEEGLKGFDDRYRFYAWALPVPYVLLSPQGIVSFVTRDQTGQITNRRDGWRSKFNIGRLLLVFAQEGLGNPTREAEMRAAKLEDWISEQLPGVQIKVQPAIVFINERTELILDEPEVPVLEPKGIKKWVRGLVRTENVKNSDYRAIDELFARQVPAENK